MTERASPQRGGLILGFVLILLGGAALLVQVGGLSIGWPIWIIVPGVALVLGAVAVGGTGGSGMATAGGIVTMVGVVLAVQEAADLYQTWAYAWALVAPGGVGVGLTVYGLLARRGDDLRSGLGALFVGVVIFLVVVSAATVTVTIGVRPLGGIQTCPLPPGTPAIVTLPEPLGNRALLDGGRVPPAPPSAP
jgi:hypothetical protein